MTSWKMDWMFSVRGSLDMSRCLATWTVIFRHMYELSSLSFLPYGFPVEDVWERWMHYRCNYCQADLGLVLLLPMLVLRMCPWSNSPTRAVDWVRILVAAQSYFHEPELASKECQNQSQRRPYRFQGRRHSPCHLVNIKCFSWETYRQLKLQKSSNIIIDRASPHNRLNEQIALHE